VARTHYWLSWLHYALGEQEPAAAHCQTALALAEKITNPKLAAQLVANLGQIQAAGADCRQALGSLERALTLKLGQVRTRFLRSVPVGFAYALGMKALVHGYLGDFEDAESDIETALRAVRGADHAVEASLFGLRGMIEIWRGRYAACVETARESRSRAERVSGPYVFATSQTLASYANLMMAPDPRALEELGSAVGWVEERGMRLFLSFSAACLGDALASAGDLGGARRYAELALARARQGDRLGEAMGHRVLARVLLHGRGSSAEAERHLDRAEEVALSHGSRRESALTRLDRAELRRREGDPTSAQALAKDALATFRTLDMDAHAERTERWLRG